MTLTTGTHVECTAGTRKKPCLGVFQTSAVGEVAAAQWTTIGWVKVEISGGGVGYRCPIHARLEPEGPVYAYQPERFRGAPGSPGRIDAREQLTMTALGITGDTSTPMHDDVGESPVARKARSQR